MTEVHQGWIKCSERLPEPIVLTKEFRCMDNRVMIYYTEDDEYWSIGFGWYLIDDRVETEDGESVYYWELDELGCIEVDVSHWMPLPENPID